MGSRRGGRKRARPARGGAWRPPRGAGEGPEGFSRGRRGTLGRGPGEEESAGTPAGSGPPPKGASAEEAARSRAGRPAPEYTGRSGSGSGSGEEVEEAATAEAESEVGSVFGEGGDGGGGGGGRGRRRWAPFRGRVTRDATPAPAGRRRALAPRAPCTASSPSPRGVLRALRCARG